MIFAHASYRNFLKATLAERTAQNSAYSLRSMARQLKVAPATLSQVMSGKKNFSPCTAYRVAQNLKLQPEECDFFCMLAQYETEHHHELKANLHTRLTEARKQQGSDEIIPRDLNVEIFKLISDWYHLPIVEMTELKNFKFNAANVAKRLGITKNEADVAIERLERLNLIEATASGYRKTEADYQFHSDVMSEALNKFHRQMLSKATEAIDRQERSERQISSNTFSIDPKLLPKANELMNKFRSELVELFNSSQENSQTYHLGLQLFKLTDSNHPRN